MIYWTEFSEGKGYSRLEWSPGENKQLKLLSGR